MRSASLSRPARIVSITSHAGDHERQRIARLDLERSAQLAQRAPSPIVAGKDRVAGPPDQPHQVVGGSARRGGQRQQFVGQRRSLGSEVRSQQAMVGERHGLGGDDGIVVRSRVGQLGHDDGSVSRLERVLGGKSNPQAGGERRRFIDVDQRGPLRRQHPSTLERRAMLMDPQPAQAERGFGGPDHIVSVVGRAVL